MPNPDGTKTDEEKREPWAVQLAREALVHIPPVTPDWVESLRAGVIRNEEDEQFVATLLRAVKDKHDFGDEKRKTITKPLNDALRATNALFKPALEGLKEVEQILKGKLADYHALKQATNVAALIEASEQATAELAVAAMVHVAPVAPPAGVSLRYQWKFEITDPSAVPHEFCSPDEKKIQAALNAGVQVPGVRTYQEPIVSSRR